MERRYVSCKIIHAYTIAKLEEAINSYLSDEIHSGGRVTYVLKLHGEMQIMSTGFDGAKFYTQTIVAISK